MGTQLCKFRSVKLCLSYQIVYWVSDWGQKGITLKESFKEQTLWTENSIFFFLVSSNHGSYMARDLPC